MTRRELIFLPGACSMLGQALASSEPQNLSFPLESIDGRLTSPDQFFVRDHFSEPELSIRTWRLKIEGRVSRPTELSFADLLESPTKKLEAVLECAGNRAGGSAVSNGLWEGAPLANLLQDTGVDRDAAMVVLYGGDSGRVMDTSPTLPYCQVVPLAKCMRPESLVAFKLNDRFLPRKNGFPARALFPGWYAMDSVKWLQRIVILGPHERASDFETSRMNEVYNRIVASNSGERKITRLSELLVKSAIAWPGDQSKLPAARHMIRGFAWTGSSRIRVVELSADGGRTWSPATLDHPAHSFSWIRWDFAWDAKPGEHVLMSRATDDAGRQQPLVRDPARKDGYELNFCAPVRCFVR
jgi:DMSO/TMAO reductase YedYZ molybdopterin-dependent catalytic subunit